MDMYMGNPNLNLVTATGTATAANLVGIGTSLSVMGAWIEVAVVHSNSSAIQSCRCLGTKQRGTIQLLWGPSCWRTWLWLN